LGYPGRREETILPETTAPLEANTIVEEEKSARLEAERPRLGLVIITNEKVRMWKGYRVHMGAEQEAYEVECAAIARALEMVARRRNKIGHLTIFTNAQAAIWRMTSGDPGPGQKYAIEARKHIAELRRRGPEVSVEIRWCPSHCGIEGNEKADEWAKQATEKPDSHSVLADPKNMRTPSHTGPLSPG